MLIRNRERRTTSIIVVPSQILLSIIFALVYYSVSHQNAVATPEQLAAFVANRPFQLRILIPAVVHLVHLFTPLPVSTLYIAASALSTWLLLVAFRSLGEEFMNAGKTSYLHFIILIPLTVNYILRHDTFYPADILSIGAFTLGLSFLIKRQYMRLWGLSVVGSFNRETIILLIPAILLLYWEDILRFRPKISAPLLASMVFILMTSIVIHYWLVWIFRFNSGESFENHIAENMQFFRYLFAGKSNYVGLVLGSFAGFHVLTYAGWTWLPSTVKRLSLLFPIALVPLFIAGRFGEIRIFGEMIPIFALAVSILVLRYIDSRTHGVRFVGSTFVS